MTKAVKAPSAGARKTRTAKPAAAKSRTAPKSGVKKPAARKSTTAAKAPRRPAGTTATARKPRAATSGTRRPAAAKSPSRRTSRAPKPKAMEVLYSGKVFRSRLEARWAVFLDLLGVNWDYEPCHYEIGPDLYYLPDFYLPDHQMWLEVKGAPFMDTASYAKVLGAVAGPQRIPLREFPYTPSERLLLGGPFRALRGGLVPVHTLITPAGSGEADLAHVTFVLGADGAAALRPSGPAWATVPATGIKAARRPSPDRLALLLEPEPHLGGDLEDRVARAYDAAYRLTFDEATKRVADNAGRTLLAALAHRRSGRPLGLARAA